jgi:hypothetical protein
MGRPKTRERELIENCQFLDIDFISKYGGTLYPIYAYIQLVQIKIRSH